MLPAVSSVSRSIVPDVVVIGGGIVGTAAAAVLAEAGAVVTLVERTGIGAGASGRNSGVVQHPFDRALRELHLESVAAYRTLAADADLGFAFPAEPAGLLLVGLDPAGPRRMAADLAATWPELRPAFLDAAAVSRLEPALAPDVSACRLELGYPVPPAAATRAMARLAERHGARLLVGQAATGIVRVGNRATGVRLADATSVPAGAVLVAAGPWSPELVDPTGAWRPIRPVWGVVVDVALGAPPRHVLEEADMDEALGDVAATTPDRGSGAGGAGVFSDGPDVAGDRPEFSLVTAAGRSTLGSTFLEAGARSGAVAAAAGRPGPPLRARPGRRAAGRSAGLRAPGRDRRPPAHRPGPRTRWGVHRRRSRPMGDLDRPGVRAPRGRPDPRPGRRRAARARPGALRGARMTACRDDRRSRPPGNRAPEPPRYDRRPPHRRRR